MVYMYLHEWLIFMVNVGKYTSPMDPMGFELGVYWEYRMTSIGPT